MLHILITKDFEYTNISQFILSSTILLGYVELLLYVFVVHVCVAKMHELRRKLSK